MTKGPSIRYKLKITNTFWYCSYETGNGIQAEERGSQRLVGEPPEAGTVSQGSYSYTDPEGKLIQVTYTADENGFVPQGNHFPTSPPVPPEILAALERNAAEEAAQNGGVISPSFHHFFRSVRTRHHWSLRRLIYVFL